MHERMRNGAEGRKTAHERKKIGLRRTGPTSFTYSGGSIRALRVALAVRYNLPDYPYNPWQLAMHQASNRRMNRALNICHCSTLKVRRANMVIQSSGFNRHVIGDFMR
eukprot:4938012-Prymnesium_polylepis.1